EVRMHRPQGTTEGSTAWVGSQCHLCHKVLRDKYKLKTHMADMHSSIQHVFTCPVCQRIYKTKNTLTNHISLSHRGYNRRQQQQHVLPQPQPLHSPHSTTSPPPVPPQPQLHAMSSAYMEYGEELSGVVQQSPGKDYDSYHSQPQGLQNEQHTSIDQHITHYSQSNQ
ncbi:unnamed protein product, partial [Meganyctiphanes norvegica]